MSDQEKVSSGRSAPAGGRGRRPFVTLAGIYAFFASVRLALGLLIAILASCVIGVTVVRGEEAGRLIFGTLWFNGLLVLLVVNVAFCFFSRIRGRRLTLISFGMILFHLSFVAMLGGIAYNSLFYFRGVLRLTEGETLPNAREHSYDYVQRGRFFDMAKLKGETTLVSMSIDREVDGINRKVVYEVAINEGRVRKSGVVYITRHFEHRGFKYFRDKEGYSVLVVLADRKGQELYGAFVPLQSLKLEDGGYLYATGTMDGPGVFPFPQDPSKPLFGLQVTYRPSVLKGAEKKGEAFFQVWPFRMMGAQQAEKPLAQGKAAVGDAFAAGDHSLSVKEVRYWVGMKVSYEPGQPIVLASLWVGLGGMIMTFAGRIGKG